MFDVLVLGFKTLGLDVQSYNILGRLPEYGKEGNQGKTVRDY